jgi:hypothetical protein
MFRHFLAKTLQALELKAIYCQNVQSFPENPGAKSALRGNRPKAGETRKTGGLGGIFAF